MEDSAVQQAPHLLSWTGHHKLWQDFVQANSCTETSRNLRAQDSLASEYHSITWSGLLQVKHKTDERWLFQPEFVSGGKTKMWSMKRLHVFKASNGFYHQIQLGVASLNIPRKVGKTTRWGKVKLSKSIFHKTYKTYHMTWSSQQTAPRYDLRMQINISKQAAAMHRFSLTQQCAGPEKKKPLINRSTKMQCLHRRLRCSRALQPPSDSSIFLFQIWNLFTKGIHLHSQSLNRGILVTICPHDQ